MAEGREKRLKRAETVDGAGVAVEVGGYIDQDTGEYLDALQDDKFSWAARKRAVLDKVTLHQMRGDKAQADKGLRCSTWLQYLAAPDGEKQLYHFNACKDRLCPICSKRRAKAMATRLFRVLKRVKADHPDTQQIFLTLTMRNVPGDELRAALSLLTKAWHKLVMRRPVMRAVKGWFRAIEITYNRAENTFHPHIHALMVVENGYFARKNGLFITQPEWEAMWQTSLQVDYRPRVDIRSTYDKRQKRKAGAALNAALEAAKYACKDTDFLDKSLPREQAADVLQVYTSALARKRFTAMAGWVAEAAKALAVDVEGDSDLIHDVDGDGPLTPETAALLEDYGWHFGVSDYVLLWRRNNPDYQGGG